MRQAKRPPPPGPGPGARAAPAAGPVAVAMAVQGGGAPKRVNLDMDMVDLLDDSSSDHDHEHGHEPDSGAAGHAAGMSRGGRQPEEQPAAGRPVFPSAGEAAGSVGTARRAEMPAVHAAGARGPAECCAARGDAVGMAQEGAAGAERPAVQHVDAAEAATASLQRRLHARSAAAAPPASIDICDVFTALSHGGLAAAEAEELLLQQLRSFGVLQLPLH